jgi:3-oxoacyl-[acyl-carrier-protein] synthase II
VVHVSETVISAWAAVSPWGLRGRDFAAGLRSGRRTAAELPGSYDGLPVRRACLVPGLDIATVLGRKGTRSMDRATALAVAAIDELLTDGAAQRLPGIGESAALALGTSMGSAQSTMDFTRESLVSARPYLVDPARFPNTVMNCAAGYSAIWHRLKGPNATVAGGRATGLLTLRYALRLMRAGRADAVLCGAVEEFSAARAWLAWHSRAGHAELVLGEGAAVWLLERRADAVANGRVPIAEVAGLEFGFAADAGQIRGVLADCLHRLLDDSPVTAAQLSGLAESAAQGAEGEAERAALTDALGSVKPASLSCADLIGDSYAASAAFGVAAVLAASQSGAWPSRWLALVTSVEAGGMVGAALLRSPAIEPTEPVSAQPLERDEGAMPNTNAIKLDLDDLRNTVAMVLDVDVSEVTDDASFVEDLGGDSLLAMEIVVVLEKKYQIKFAEDELAELTSLPKAYELLASKLADG